MSAEVPSLHYLRPGRVVLLLWVTAFAWMIPGAGLALDPEEILVVANQRVVEGVDLAKYYMKKRKIPKRNVVVVDAPENETCSREIYEKEIAVPVRKRLQGRRFRSTIRCLVLIYGMPLKVEAPGNRIQEKFLRVRQQIRDLDPTADEKETGTRPDAETSALRSRLKRQLINTDQRASVDSELTVVKAIDAPIAGWLENPFYTALGNRLFPVEKDEILWVSRLDGPDANSVKRLIHDALAAEKDGLSGNACFDARWPVSTPIVDSAYVKFDRSLHRAAKRIGKIGNNSVIFNDTGALFQRGECPDAALYCGWYSLATYVDAFEWRRGAVGYHVASYECSTLKRAGSQVWCKRMIEKGICATLGPVNEPYLRAFPLPDLFFGFLTEGRRSLVECYMKSLPYLSWQMVLVGDPLYRPFTR